MRTIWLSLNSSVNLFLICPTTLNHTLSIYKNRRGQYKDILLWCEARRGTCRIIPMFATDYNYQLIDLPDLKITINPKLNASAF